MEFLNVPFSFVGLHTCADLKRTGAGIFDGEYLLYPKRACSSPVKVYCHGMDSKSPRDYLTLPAGPINNFAMIYDKRLRPEDRGSCTGKVSSFRYSKAGLTKFHKVIGAEIVCFYFDIVSACL